MENDSSLDITDPPPLDIMEPSPLTYSERTGVAIVILIIFVLGTVGNSIVILAVALSKDLHTIPNVFVVSLAVADLCYCLLLPLSSVVALLSRDGWPWHSETLCFLSALMAFTSAGASLYNLACIALNRLFVIRGPVRAHVWLFTTKKTIFLVAGTWVLPLAAMLIPLAFGIGALGYDKQDNTCSDIDTHPRFMEYHFVQVFCFYPIPLLILIISYSLLFLHVKHHFKHREESFKTSHEMADLKTDDEMQDKVKARFKKRANRQQVQITKNLFIVSCIFVVSSAPYSVALLTTSNARTLLFLSVLFTFNSCVNPIVYTVNHPRFNVVIRCILGCRFEDIPKPSVLLVSARERFCRA